MNCKFLVHHFASATGDFLAHSIVCTFLVDCIILFEQCSHFAHFVLMPSLQVPQNLNQFFSLCFVPFPVNCSYELCSSTPAFLPSNHTHPFILSNTPCCTFLDTSHYPAYLLKMHLLHLYVRTHRSFKGNVIGTLPFYFHIQHINLFPVKLAFHFSLKSHILCLCCCFFLCLNAPAKST